MVSQEKSQAPVRVAIIGAGGIARGVHLPSLNDMPDVEIAAVCDLVETRARAMAEKYGIPKVYTLYKEMLVKERDGLDAVFVLVEPANLFHVVWFCLEAGLPTFMEKPPGITLFQTESLARKSEETGKILQVGFNRRHIPVVRRAVEMVRERTTITHVEGCFYKFGTGSFDRGSLSAFMSDTIHAVDLVRAIAGGEAVKVSSIRASWNEPFPNLWAAVIQFDNGVSGIVRANYRAGGRVHRFEAHGPGVSAFINLGFGGADCDAVLLSHAGQAQYSLAAAGAGTDGVVELDGQELAGSKDFYRFYGFYQEDRHFIDCVRAGTVPETSIRNAVGSMRLAEMIAANVI
jgi:predicted dehydrogenase